MRFLDRLQPLALLALRLILGVVMIGHGYGKVFHGGLAQHVAACQQPGTARLVGLSLRFHRILWRNAVLLPVC